jgi:hypothetical protein
MQTPSQSRAAGLAFLGCGVAFLAVALTTGQYAFLGVGPAMLALGIVFLARSRR